MPRRMNPWSSSSTNGGMPTLSPVPSRSPKPARQGLPERNCFLNQTPNLRGRR
jgi:hypothetical protein